jgi:hypothetical protein
LTRPPGIPESPGKNRLKNIVETDVDKVICILKLDNYCHFILLAIVYYIFLYEKRQNKARNMEEKEGADLINLPGSGEFLARVRQEVCGKF